MSVTVLSEHRAQHPMTQWTEQQHRIRLEHVMGITQVVLDSRWNKTT